MGMRLDGKVSGAHFELSRGTHLRFPFSQLKEGGKGKKREMGKGLEILKSLYHGVHLGAETHAHNPTGIM